MGMIGNAAAGVSNMFGSLIGGLSTRKRLKEIKNNIKGQMQDNEDWYNRRYNEDATQRADAQAMLTQTRDMIRENNRAAAGSAAVMGGTDESVAQTKQANADALAQTSSNIIQNAETRKDAIENTYLQNKSKLNDDLNNLTMQQAQNTQQAVQGAAAGSAQVAKACPW